MRTEQKPLIRPATANLLDAFRLDFWPLEDACTDFGIYTWHHFEALAHAYRCDGVTPEQFDAALGNGPEIQKLISKDNPYGYVTFQTCWDDLPTEAEISPEPKAE